MDIYKILCFHVWTTKFWWYVDHIIFSKSNYFIESSTQPIRFFVFLSYEQSPEVVSLPLINYHFRLLIITLYCYSSNYFCISYLVVFHIQPEGGTRSTVVARWTAGPGDEQLILHLGHHSYEKSCH